jgi:acyl carrier protein
VHVTYRRITAADVEQEAESIIGEPIPDLQIHLLGENMEPVVGSETGEMYIGGAGVAWGYLGRPELTAERFLPDPRTGGRLYRSGDLARRRSDGELVYMGRADRQIKINGFRVEPGEIEAALAELPNVRQVCVTPMDAEEGARFLTAYFTATETLDQRALAAHIAKKLPAHMRPTFYLQLPSLPLTINGKVDRDALPHPQTFGNSLPIDNRKATLSRQIAELWASLLQVEEVSETRNFFDAGGTSLQLMALRTALQQRLDHTVPMLWLFEHTTPRSLANRLEEKLPETPTASPARPAAELQRQSFAKARALRSATL